MSSLLKIINAKISDKSKLGEWYQDRLKVCLSCEYNSENKKNLTITDKVIIAANLGKAACLACGCEIAAKASIQTEDCGIIKKGLKSKWLKINLDKQEEFLVICKNENVKFIHIKGNHYEIDYGKIPFQYNSEVGLTISKEELEISKLNSQASCGCTVLELTFNNNIINFNIKYDTLRLGSFAKTTSLTIRDKNNKVYNIFINIKGEVYEL